VILRYEDYDRQSVFTTDILVIGTGAGGGAVGAELAADGFDVTFVEEGSYHPTSTFNPYATESVPRLYRDSGATVIMGTPQIPFVEGRTVGGTTVINGGMTYRTPDDVLDTWQDLTGSPEMGVEGMTPLFERVEGIVHAKHQHEASVGNDSRIMAQGAERLGWKVEINKRNQESCTGANLCVFGCPTGAKQSTLVSYMPRAMKSGARCLTEVRIHKLLIRGGRCVGAVGRAIDPITRRRGPRVVIKAKATIVCGGAIQTPYLLKRHRLGKPSGQLGRNFLCHPNAKLIGFYPGRVNAWQGVSQYSQVREFHDEGLLFAENFIPPSAMAANLPVFGDRALELLKRYDNAVVSGVLVEDSTTGTVSRGPFGMAIARYDITHQDHSRFLKGVELLSTLHFEMGADSVALPFHDQPFASSMDEVRRIIATQTSRHTLELFTVHLMGTARMGATPESSVVDLGGQLWDLPGAYVADASLFPTAIGVNPQITIMALATRVAARLIEARGSVLAAA